MVILQLLEAFPNEAAELCSRLSQIFGLMFRCKFPRYRPRSGETNCRSPCSAMPKVKLRIEQSGLPTHLASRIAVIVILLVALPIIRAFAQNFWQEPNFQLMVARFAKISVQIGYGTISCSIGIWVQKIALEFSLLWPWESFNGSVFWRLLSPIYGAKRFVLYLSLGDGISLVKDRLEYLGSLSAGLIANVFREPRLNLFLEVGIITFVNWFCPPNYLFLSVGLIYFW